MRSGFRRVVLGLAIITPDNLFNILLTSATCSKSLGVLPVTTCTVSAGNYIGIYVYKVTIDCTIHEPEGVEIPKDQFKCRPCQAERGRYEDPSYADDQLAAMIPELLKDPHLPLRQKASFIRLVTLTSAATASGACLRWRRISGMAKRGKAT